MRNGNVTFKLQSIWPTGCIWGWAGWTWGATHHGAVAPGRDALLLIAPLAAVGVGGAAGAVRETIAALVNGGWRGMEERKRKGGKAETEKKRWGRGKKESLNSRVLMGEKHICIIRLHCRRATSLRGPHEPIHKRQNCEETFSRLVPICRIPRRA